MQMIRCPRCGKRFLWTDEMPLKGPCSDPACGGAYDLRAALRESVAARRPEPPPGPACPACSAPLPARRARCRRCGRIVAGRYALRPQDLLLGALLALAVAALLIRLGLDG